MSFQEAFPELKAVPPQLPGQQNLAPSVLHQFRRQQLHDLARAYGIRVKKDGTKLEILPMLIDAEARGIFRGPPLDDYYLRKAARSPDDHGIVIEGQPNSEKRIAPVERQETNYEDPRPFEKQPIWMIRKAAKKAGMQIDQRTKKVEMLDFLEGKNEAP